MQFSATPRFRGLIPRRPLCCDVALPKKLAGGKRTSGLHKPEAAFQHPLTLAPQSAASTGGRLLSNLLRGPNRFGGKRGWDDESHSARNRR